MEQLRKLSRLSGQQWRVLLYACLLLNGIRLALWLLPFGEVRKLLAKMSHLWNSHEPTETASVGFIVRAVKIAAARCTPGRPLCLARALTAQSLLDGHGHAHQLRIGVAKDAANRLTAHAWIEYEGRVILGAVNGLNRYQPLVTTVGAASAFASRSAESRAGS